jgi:hypothetical protein
MKHWLFNCQHVSEKISTSLDGNLPLPYRVMMRFHGLMCPPCASFQRQLMLMRKACRYEDASGENEPGLSEQARERISKAMKDCS